MIADPGNGDGDPRSGGERPLDLDALIAYLRFDPRGPVTVMIDAAGETVRVAVVDNEEPTPAPLARRLDVLDARARRIRHRRGVRVRRDQGGVRRHRREAGTVGPERVVCCSSPPGARSTCAPGTRPGHLVARGVGRAVLFGPSRPHAIVRGRACPASSSV